MGSGEGLVMMRMESDALGMTGMETWMMACGACGLLVAIGMRLMRTLEMETPDVMRAWERLRVDLKGKLAGCGSWM